MFATVDGSRELELKISSFHTKSESPDVVRVCETSVEINNNDTPYPAEDSALHSRLVCRSETYLHNHEIC